MRIHLAGELVPIESSKDLGVNRALLESIVKAACMSRMSDWWLEIRAVLVLTHPTVELESCYLYWHLRELERSRAALSNSEV